MTRHPPPTIDSRLLRLRAVVNWANLSTPAGLLLARVAATGAHPIERGLWLAAGYHWAVPVAPAFTLGNVILVRAHPVLAGDPRAGISAKLLGHEDRHATQYAFCGGPALPVLYLVAAGWSWLRTGDYASRNVFERRAGLASGGYQERPPRQLTGLLLPGKRRLRDSGLMRGQLRRPPA